MATCLLFCSDSERFRVPPSTFALLSTMETVIYDIFLNFNRESKDHLGSKEKRYMVIVIYFVPDSIEDMCLIFKKIK